MTTTPGDPRPDAADAASGDAPRHDAHPLESPAPAETERAEADSASADLTSADDLDGTAEDEKSGRRRRQPRSAFLEYAATLVVAVLIAVLIKTFLLQPFFIPSASMSPTLAVDDKILVSKLHPGVLDIERGDVVVFEDPHDWIPGSALDNPGPRVRLAQVLSLIGLAPDPAQDHLVKRVVGLPGDHVVCPEPGAQLEVNGVTIDEPYINPETPACHTAFDVRVPDDNLWVLGDNRFASADSSVHNQTDGRSGFVPMDAVTGRAVVIFWPASNWGGLGEGRDAFAGVPDAA